MHLTAVLGEPSPQQSPALACRISMLMSITLFEASIEGLERAVEAVVNSVAVALVDAPATRRV
jgi:hypothetical protein